ncbi:MAG: hypothetical protein ACYTFY_14585 [Planctomycetota bacterium]|jgi:recombinational DNA repair protein (RecF pathway)
METDEFEINKCLECKNPINIGKGRYHLNKGSICTDCFSRTVFLKHTETDEAESAHFEKQ